MIKQIYTLVLLVLQWFSCFLRELLRLLSSICGSIPPSSMSFVVREMCKWNYNQGTDEGNIVYISHHDMKRMRKTIFHDRASYGGHTIYGFSSDSGSGWKMEWKRWSAFRTLWSHSVVQEGDDTRRMFLEALEGFSFSVGNISNYDNFAISCSELSTYVIITIIYERECLESV